MLAIRPSHATGVAADGMAGGRPASAGAAWRGSTGTQASMDRCMGCRTGRGKALLPERILGRRSAPTDRPVRRCGPRSRRRAGASEASGHPRRGSAGTSGGFRETAREPVRPVASAIGSPHPLVAARCGAGPDLRSRVSPPACRRRATVRRQRPSPPARRDRSSGGAAAHDHAPPCVRTRRPGAARSARPARTATGRCESSRAARPTHCRRRPAGGGPGSSDAGRQPEPWPHPGPDGSPPEPRPAVRPVRARETSAKCPIRVVRPAGFEPVTLGLGIRNFSLRLNGMLDPIPGHPSHQWPQRRQPAV